MSAIRLIQIMVRLGRPHHKRIIFERRAHLALVKYKYIPVIALIADLSFDLKSGWQFPIVSGMRWLIAGLALAAVALLLRRILRMDANQKNQAGSLGFLREDVSNIFQPVAREIETQTAILGITLNEAFGEREAARPEMAWHIVRLALGEWERLTELVVGLQGLLVKFLPATEDIVVVRRIAVGRFKSRAVIDKVMLYEFLDQILFSSKRRLALQLRLLTRTSATLNREFRNACREGKRTLDFSDELWTRLDYYFHDFDLITKETLLAFRTLLICQSAEATQELALDLQTLLERGKRVSISLTHQ